MIVEESRRPRNGIFRDQGQRRYALDSERTLRLHHLAEVRRGRTVTVTDHGHVIARIVPAGTPTALERLIEEGRVTPAKRRKRQAPVPIPAVGTVSDLVTEHRR